MRGSFVSPNQPFPHSVPESALQQSIQPDAVTPHSAPPTGLSFMPFGADAFARARTRHVPVFLMIADVPELPADPSLLAQLTERTVPVFLRIGERPDVELLCQRAGALFSGEGALPLCALLLGDARPFLAAPLPPAGFPLDPSRLYVWLSQADRRFSQNPPAIAGQAAQVLRSFQCAPLRRPYAPSDAAYDLTRALLAAEDRTHGGFGHQKAPLVCALRFLQHAAQRIDPKAHSLLSRTLDTLLSSALYDPLDGSFFRATLTEDWRVFIPEKPLGINALLALTLLSDGRRNEAVRLLHFIVQAFSLQGGGLSPSLLAPRESYAFTVKQTCAALGDESGLRACRLLGLLRQHTPDEPFVTPSRFSPVEPHAAPRLGDAPPPRYPRLPSGLPPEDEGFLHHALPLLLRARAARPQQQPLGFVVTEHAALAAAVLAMCGRRLGESRFTQAAQRTVSFLAGQSPVAGFAPLPASLFPASPLFSQATCGASAALALAQLALAPPDGPEAYAQGGLRLLGAALHAFVRPDGLVMHTPQDAAAFFPRVPAIYDGELPSPAALLVHALRMADSMRPEAHYRDAIEAIWHAAAPAAKAQPIACASLIDAMSAQK